MCNTVNLHKTTPGFGVPVENYQEVNYQSLVKKTIVIASAILIGCAIGCATGGLPGLVVGVALVGAVALTAVIVDQMRNRRFCHRFQSALPKQPHVDVSAPSLGQAAKAKVRVINHAKESFEWKKELINSACSSIELSPNFAGGEDFQEILDLIEVRMEKKPFLRTHLLLSSDLLENNNVRKLQELDKKFGDRFNYLVTDRIYCTAPFLHSEENHVKMLVVDGKFFFTGGTGIHPKMGREDYSPSTDTEKGSFASSFIDKGFRDTDIVGKGAVALTMRKEFFSLFQKWENRMRPRDKDHFFPNRFFTLKHANRGRSARFSSSEPGLIRDVSVKCFVGGPEHRGNNPITNRIVKRVNKAENEIQLGNLLFNPDQSVKKAMKSKNDAVKIIGHFNGTGEKSSVSHYMYALPNRFNYDLFSEAYEYEQPNQLYHKKVATFDKKYTVIGSYNLGQKSCLTDDEIVLEIKSSKVAEAVNKGLEEDKKRSKRLTGSALKPFSHKILGFPVTEILGTYFG